MARIPAPRAARLTFMTLLLATLALLAAVFLPLWKPLFMAAVLAAAVQPLYSRLAARLGGKPKVAAVITTVLLVLVVLIPIILLSVVVVSEAVSAYQFIRTTLEHGGVEELLATLPHSIEGGVRRLLALVPEDIKPGTAAAGKAAAGFLSQALATVGNLAFALVMMLIAFYALLVKGDQLFGWVKDVSPLPETSELIDEARRTSGNVLRSTFLTALAQGSLATVGYLICGVPQPIFFGVVTFFAAFIPSVGTAIVSIPLVILLFLSGKTWQPIVLAVWGVALVGTIDNLLRPFFIRGGGMQVDGVIVFFALIGGVLVFGSIGILVGPLAVTLFLAMIRFAYRDYVEPQDEDQLIVAPTKD
jgi:predicted PurR-regulated permease PerM